MEDYRIVLIKNFSNRDVTENFDKNWADIMDMAEIINGMGSFNHCDITQHEKKLLNDLRAYVRQSILMFDKSKAVNCIVDFIVTYNIVFDK